MKVALLTAKPNTDGKVGNYKFWVGEKRPPNGIGFLYAVLKDAGHSVGIFDYYCGCSVNTNFADYDFVGIYTTTVCLDHLNTLFKTIKAKTIAVGGPHAMLYVDTIPDSVDHICIGEGEEIIVSLVEGNCESRIIRTTRIEDLDNLPTFPYEVFFTKYRHLYDWGFEYSSARPVFTMNTSRGCPFNCSFCSVPKLWNRIYTSMSAERVVDEISFLVRRFGAKGVYFREDNFTAKPNRVAEICELLLKKNIKIEWACETRVDTVNPSLLVLMYRAGCRGLYVGVEHLSQRMLDIFNKKITVDQIVKFFEVANCLGMYTHASFITNHPEETEQDRKINKALLKIIHPSRIVNNVYRKDG